MIEKHKRIEIPKLLNAANGRSCIKCGKDDGTIIRAHYSGIGAYQLGKGNRVKCHDFITADLCDECHSYFDHYEHGNTYERAFEFFILIFLTQERDFKAGLLK